MQGFSPWGMFFGISHAIGPFSATSSAVTQKPQNQWALASEVPRPSLNTHEFTSLSGVNGEKVFEAYAQNNTPGAYRIFWHYGPDQIKGKKRAQAITILAITSHP